MPNIQAQNLKKHKQGYNPITIVDGMPLNVVAQCRMEE